MPIAHTASSYRRMSTLLRACCACAVLHLLCNFAVHGVSFPSRVECLDGVEDSANVCILKDVAVWNGSVYLLHNRNAEASDLPRLRLASWPYAPSYNVHDFFKSVALDDTPFAHVQNVTRHAQAVLHHASLPSNHAHNFVETLPALFERLCRFFGLCDYSNHSARKPGGLLLLWVERHARASVLPSLHDAVACMSSRQMALERAPSDEVIMVQEFLVGIPSAAACQSKPLCERRNALSEADMMPMRLRFMRECAGLSSEPPLRSGAPRVLFINRRHHAGRSVLAMAEAYNYFKVHYADHEHERGTFKLTYMEGLTFADQAKLFDSADILIIPHGATFGNVIFAARQSIIVHVSATEGHKAFNEQWSHAFDAVLNITTIAVQPTLVGGLDLISAKLHSAVQHWTQEQLLGLIAKGLCPDGEAWCESQGPNIFSQNLNYAVDYEELVQQVVEAMRVWRSQRSNEHPTPMQRAEHGAD